MEENNKNQDKKQKQPQVDPLHYQDCTFIISDKCSQLLTGLRVAESEAHLKGLFYLPMADNIVYPDSSRQVVVPIFPNGTTIEDCFYIDKLNRPIRYWFIYFNTSLN